MSPVNVSNEALRLLHEHEQVKTTNKTLAVGYMSLQSTKSITAFPSF